MTGKTLAQRWEKPTFEVVAHVCTSDGVLQYERLERNGRIEWKTKRTAEKHAREYKARYLKDAWVSEC